MKTKIALSIFLLVLSVTLAFSQNTINLSGKWKVNLDKQNELVVNYPDETTTSGTIILPGSLAEKGFGYKTSGSDFGILTPEYKYIGKAWYKKQIEIPKNWAGKDIEILLERVLWESRILIDGEELSKQDALGAPHIHKLGKISPGMHELTILVDNEMIHNIGDKGHAYGEYTQSIWNGIVGRMEMTARDLVSFKQVNVYSDIESERISINAEIYAEESSAVEINYEIISVSNNKTIFSGSVSDNVRRGKTGLEWPLKVEGKLTKWSEFAPEVYTLKLKLRSGEKEDWYETEFGYCQIGHNGTKLLVNGTPVFLRGNLDCVHFPITGYASCDLDDWIKIFKTYREYGLNHARFHSWCPPEAAFKAANRVGIYLQAEASIWIDWWMSVDNTERGRPEMNAKGFPKGLGHDAERDKFVVAEMNRVVDTYGNNPSFTMFCIGNELGNSDFNVMKQWVADLKEKDPRRLYAVSTARTITEVDDYCATHYIKDVGRTRGLNGPHTDWSFEDVYSKMNIPIIAHEIGQWPVYPRWSEIDKYTGVLKARNFEEFKHQAEKNGIGDQSDDFADASGALNQIMYKYETESFLRTASCAGVQLLSMQDYQGQGEALIGWLDCFWESKGITTPEKFRQHFTETVPLLLFEKYVWENNEEFNAEVKLSHHSEKELNGEVHWTVTDDNGQEIKSGSFDKMIFENGSLSAVGNIKFALNKLEKATKLTVLLEVLNTEFKNEWDIWVYPPKTEEDVANSIIVADELDTETLDKLRSGAKVLLQANQLGTDETSVKALFYPLYWSLTFFPGQGKTNIGLLLQDQHPAFNNFPTSFHSNWQWETISADAKGFILNELPHEYKPIAQPVDDFHRNNKVGSVFELKVGEGKLLVCGYNLKSEKPVARQLKQSLIAYMNSVDFNPTQTADEKWLIKTLKSIPKAEKADIPEEFNNAILLVNAAKNVQDENKNIPWGTDLDEVKIAENVTYKIVSAGTWKEGTNTAWHGKEMTLQINCPEGMLGSLLVHFHDWNNQKRTGMLDFEGRKSKLDLHRGDGFWVKFHVMREDSNDGKLILKTKAETGSNLMITKVVLLKE
uniref:glycoside hydrolase family 2 TIM barrel-domain containing protein n=1 Tax=uncultured Draconibacterium sp. TaxID=1573823 RepID=UPI0032172B42